jgi:hypothetical protein
MQGRVGEQQAAAVHILPAAGATVEGVAHEGGAQVGEVHPDLVGAPGEQLALHQGHAGGAGQDPDAGLGGTPTFGHHHPQAVALVPGDGLVDQEAAHLGQLGGVAHQGQVPLLHGAGLELVLDGTLGLRRLGQAEAAGGVPIEAVDEAGPPGGQFLAILGGLLVAAGEHRGLQSVQQGVDDGAAGVPGPGVHHHATGLVDDPELRVLIQRGQVDGLGLQVRGRGLGQGQLGFHHVPGPEAHPSLGDGDPIHLDGPQAHVGVPAGPGHLGEPVGQVAVQSGGAVLGDQAEHFASRRRIQNSQRPRPSIMNARPVSRPVLSQAQPSQPVPRSTSPRQVSVITRPRPSTRK